MAGSRSSRRYNDEDEEEEEEPEEDEEEEPTPRRRTRASARRGRRPPHRPPVQRWRATEEDEDEEEEEEEGEPPSHPLPWRKKPIYWRARDSLFFEPLIALAIIVLLLVSLWAYTQNWPPVYVVESNSMQHGPDDHLGLINAGDMVLAQKIPFAQITTYVEGLQSGYSTYGEPGDVVLYWPNGQGSTPVIHRAMLYLQFEPPNFYNVTIPSGLPCGNASNPDWAYLPFPGAQPTCSTTHLDGYLYFYHVGWDSQTVVVDLTPSNAPSTLGDQSGLLTMGDNNSQPDQLGVSPISHLVQSNWIIGVARGMIPWFGSLKLLLDGDAGNVPAQSWELMGLTIVGVIVAAFAIHYALRTEGIETPLRRKEEEEAMAEEEETEASEPTKRRWFPRLRRKHREEEDEEAEEEAASRRRTRPRPSHTPTRRGRPVPRVRRAEKSKKRHASDDDEL
jgi:signal peptidase